MFTLNHHVYAVAGILNNGPKSDDANIPTSRIEHQLFVSRATLIKRELDKYNTLSDTSFQTVCLDLELHEFHDCNCVPDSGCELLRSVKKLPSSLTSKWGKAGTALFLDGRQIPYVTLSGSKYIEYSLANPKSVVHTIHNGYLWIIGSKSLKKVMYKEIFENPLELQDYDACTSSANGSDPCYDSAKDNFPIEGHLIKPMYDMTVDDLRKAFGMPADEANNAVAPKTSKYQE